MIKKPPVQELRINPVIGFIIDDFGEERLDQVNNEPERGEYDYLLHLLITIQFQVAQS